jgi:arylsulfatase A-like enzyme
MNRLLYQGIACMSLLAASAAQAQSEKTPNIVLILCDDMGFSDIGCYGSEIKTPHIDQLAADGVRFSQFKNTGRSCPSRAALLTGRYSHEAGMGWMAEVDEHRPGYRGQIDKEYPTIAEVLKSGGYSTYMSGKWHVTTTGAYDAPNGSYPVQRGFDRYYGCLHGGGSYYKPSPLYNNLEKITDLPDDYYYTQAISDSAVSFIEKHDSRKPMFLYVAHYAPHLPLQAPQKYVDKCIERYKAGYDVLRKKRFEKQQQLGIVPAGMELPIFDREFGGKRPAWEELTKEQQEKWINDMATYAAMIEIMDEGVGKIMDAVKAKGIYENTVFIFLSDNGATEEGGYIGQLMSDLSNTPYRSYKQWVYQGGTSTPFILTYGSGKKQPMKGKICHQPAHLIDILPTCMAIGKTGYPAHFAHADLEGRNLIPASEGKPLEKRTLYFEHQSSCAIIDGSWKLVRASRNTPWELINLETDPFETCDLSHQYPEKVEELETKWIEWANTHKVFPLENKPWTERINFYKAKNPDQSGK